MLDIKYIRDNVDAIKVNTQKRGVSVDIDKLIALDDERRAIIAKKEELRAAQKAGSKGKPSPEELEKMKQLSEEVKTLEATLAEITESYTALLMQVPNTTHPDVPTGGEEDFNTLETVGDIPTFDFPPKDHEELMTHLDMIDFERGAKVVGSKFYYLKNDAVRLNQALINYGIDVVTKHGFTLMETPDLARNEIIENLGFNPRGEASQIYNVTDTDTSLIGTAEVTLGGYHKDEIIDLSDGPKKYAALSHCFRKEAGSYGRTSKGMYRVHQFSKLEMFVFCKPEESEQIHEELLAIEKEICDALELPYRVIDIASGDLGGPAYRKYDIEAYMTLHNDYGEITSTSNCTDYQARRLNVRYKDGTGKPHFVHTLNGTAVVLSRFPVAIVENYQQENGTIAVPSVLVPYMGKNIMGA